MTAVEAGGAVWLGVRVVGSVATSVAVGEIDRGTPLPSGRARMSIVRFVALTVYLVVCGMGWVRVRSVRCSAPFADVASAFPDDDRRSFALVVVLRASGRCSA